MRVKIQNCPRRFDQRRTDHKPSNLFLDASTEGSPRQIFFTPQQQIEQKFSISSGYTSPFRKDHGPHSLSFNYTGTNTTFFVSLFVNEAPTTSLSPSVRETFWRPIVLLGWGGISWRRGEFLLGFLLWCEEDLAWGSFGAHIGKKVVWFMVSAALSSSLIDYAPKNPKISPPEAIPKIRHKASPFVTSTNEINGSSRKRRKVLLTATLADWKTTSAVSNAWTISAAPIMTPDDYKRRKSKERQEGTFNINRGRATLVRDYLRPNLIYSLKQFWRRFWNPRAMLHKVHVDFVSRYMS